MSWIMVQCLTDSMASTNDTLMYLKSFVLCFVFRCYSKYALGIFVDLKGEFYYLIWQVLKSYFHGRKTFVQGVNEHMWVNLERGCPQGSIAGAFI